MSKADLIRRWYDEGKIDNSPESKRRVAAELGITVQTVHATLKNHTTTPYQATIDTASQSIKEAIVAKVAECHAIARKAFPNANIPDINIRFDINGATGGLYYTYKQMYKFNLQLAHNPNYIDEVVPHEVAHHVARCIYGPMVKAHGFEWQMIMVAVFRRKPVCRHTFDTIHIKMKKHGRIYVYTCDCGLDHPVSPLIHSRIVNPTNGYRRICLKCKSQIRFKTILTNQVA